MARGGFRSVGSIAAELVAFARRVDVQVGDCTATVLEAEGCAQVIWHRGEPGPLAGPAALWNDFLQPGVGAQLRVLADAVDAATARMDQGGIAK